MPDTFSTFKRRRTTPCANLHFNMLPLDAMDVILQFLGRSDSMTLKIVAKSLPLVLSPAVVKDWCDYERRKREQNYCFCVEDYPTLDITHLNLADNINSFAVTKGIKDGNLIRQPISDQNFKMFKSLQSFGWLPSALGCFPWCWWSVACLGRATAIRHLLTAAQIGLSFGRQHSLCCFQRCLQRRTKLQLTCRNREAVLQSPSDHQRRNGHVMENIRF